jgi:hypothetical protein
MSFLRTVLAPVVALLFLAPGILAQSPEGAGTSSTPHESALGSEQSSESYYSRLNSWGIFGEYGPDSRHLLWGFAEQRYIITAGVEYARRLHLSDNYEIDYVCQVLPLFLERDPVFIGFKSVATGQILFPSPPERVVNVIHSTNLVEPGNIVITQAYTSQWNYAAGLTPLGFRLNVFPHHRIQPYFNVNGGFVVGPHDIPVDATNNFNFTIAFGGGIESYISRTHSVRVGWSFHHHSNAYTGATNPGVDVGLIQLTYLFGH